MLSASPEMCWALLRQAGAVLGVVIARQRGFYALGAWVGSVPHPAIPPGTEGLEPVQTEPRPHPCVVPVSHSG